MSKHNNNLMPSSSRRCRCGRYMTLGEDAAGIGTYSYTCPDCFHREHTQPLSSEQHIANLKDDR